MNNTAASFRQLWSQFHTEELLTSVDYLFNATPTFVRENLRCINLQQGSKLIKQGNESNFVYIILDGEFLVNKSARNGRELGITLCYQGEFLGEVEALTREKSQYDVIALRDSRVVRIATHHFLRWLEHDHACSQLLNRQLAKRLLISGEQRLLNISDSTENNLLYILEHMQEHKINLSREVLANILCTSTRHLNKVILGLREKKRIQQEGNLLQLLSTS